MKEALKSALRRSIGIQLVKVDRNPIQAPTYYTAAELARLDADLDALYAREKFIYYPTPKALRKYLHESRINQYHEGLQICIDAGVELADKSVVEIGVGSGYLLRLISDRFPTAKVFGTDYFEELVRLARGLAPKAEVIQAGIEDLSASHRQYDVIFCMEVIEHILDTETPIPRMLDLLAPGGVLMLTVPDAIEDRTPALETDNGNTFVGHVNYWGEESWPFYLARVAPEAKIDTGRMYSQPSFYAILRRS